MPNNSKMDPNRLVAIDTHVHIESEVADNAAGDAARKYFGNAGVEYSRKALADKLFKVWRLDGQEAWLPRRTASKPTFIIAAHLT